MIVASLCYKLHQYHSNTMDRHPAPLSPPASPQLKTIHHVSILHLGYITGMQRPLTIWVASEFWSPASLRASNELAKVLYCAPRLVSSNSSRQVRISMAYFPLFTLFALRDFCCGSFTFNFGTRWDRMHRRKLCALHVLFSYFQFPLSSLFTFAYTVIPNHVDEN